MSTRLHRAGQPRPNHLSPQTLSGDPGLAQLDAEKLLLAEFEQAWTHYRHLENTRAQYLGFFFTITLGSVGFGGPILASRKVSPTLLMVVSLFLLSYTIFTALAYVSIRKLGVVMWHYGEVMEVVRRRFYAGTVLAPGGEHEFRVWDVNHPLLLSKLFRVQTSAELVLATFLFASAIGQVFVAATLSTAKPPVPINAITASTIAAFMLALDITLVSIGRRKSMAR